MKTKIQDNPQIMKKITSTIIPEKIFISSTKRPENVHQTALTTNDVNINDMPSIHNGPEIFDWLNVDFRTILIYH